MALPSQVVRNGTLISPPEATVSVFNSALFGAFGVYESIQVVGGVIFAEQAHFERLERSAELLGLRLPGDRATLAGWMRLALAANAVSDCTLRAFVVGDVDGDGSTAYIWPQAATVYPATYYVDGVEVVTFEGRRAIPAAKSLNTLVNYLAVRQARAAGAHEALLCHDGVLTEGSSSNLFVVMDGRLMTPPADQVLSGVTRDLVLGIAESQGISFVETDLRLRDAPRWTECFITSTSRHVMPVTRIDGRMISDGRVGSLTSRLRALFERAFAEALTIA